MLKFMEALEKDLYVDVNEKDKEKIIDMFELAMSIQLPVMDKGKIVGILDLYRFLHNLDKPTKINSIMDRDITVAGDKIGKFTFSSTNQFILPFVNKDGEYIGFVNRLTQKCYLPSKEYMRVIEKKINGSVDEELGGLSKEEFDAVIEYNYDGLYITVEKGSTLGINNKCKYIPNITEDDIVLDTDKGEVSIEENPEESIDISVAQNIQKRNEISVTSDDIPDGSIIRVIQNFENFEKMRNELETTKILAEKYQTELDYLKWGNSDNAPKIIAKSQEMKKVVNLALKIAKSDSTVLIQGQSGVGKGILSKMIHDNSARSDSAFVKIDCGSIPDNLLESELFGYEKGAFTGADKDGKKGYVEAANGGTLFLDEIGEVPLSLQSKLLRFLQDKQIVRVGGNTTIPIDARVIAATNRDLEEMVSQKMFRKDLFYRLNVVPITIPPLRDRKEDVIPLINNMISKYNSQNDTHYSIDRSAMKQLVNYDWPGNIRELENIIEYSIVTSNTETINEDDLPEKIVKKDNRQIKNEADDVVSLKKALDDYEYSILINTMKKSKSIQEMGDRLNVDRSTMSRKLLRHKIEPDFK